MREIGIGIVGGGYMGKRHAVAFSAVAATFELSIRPRLVSVAASSPESAARYRDAYGFERAALNWRALVEDQDVEAVVIASTPASHCEIALAAFERGKHVLCEKPMADTLDNARAMAVAARPGPHTRHVAMMGFNYSRTPATRHARKLIADGAIGAITHIRATNIEDFLADPNLPDDARAEGDARGAMSDLGSHALDLALALGGPITGIMARIESVYDDRPLPGGGRAPASDDRADLLVQFAGGYSGTIEVSRVATGMKMGYGYEVRGTRGAIRFDGEDQNSLHLYRADVPEAERGFTRILIGPEHGDYAAFCEGPGHGTGYGDQITIEARDFLLAIAEGNEVETDFTHGLYIAELTEAARRSAREGRWVAMESVGA